MHGRLYIFFNFLSVSPYIQQFLFFIIFIYFMQGAERVQTKFEKRILKAKKLRRDVYKLGEEYLVDENSIIGFGNYGHVLLGQSINEKEHLRIRVAVKVCKAKDQNTEFQIVNQAYMMSVSHHPNIVEYLGLYLYESKSHEKRYFIVQEYLEGGDLFQYITQHKFISQNNARQIMRTLVDALAYLHESRIIHRDLKLQNIIFAKKFNMQLIKIIDFGVSRMLSDNETSASTYTGTYLYMAPEIFMNKKYNNSADIWSLGFILYMMVSGEYPYQVDEQNQMIYENQLRKKIMKQQISFCGEEWQNISDECKDLISKMLKKNPAQRIPLKEILNHNWITGERSNTHLPLAYQNLKKKQNIELKKQSLIKSSMTKDKKTIDSEGQEKHE